VEKALNPPDRISLWEQTLGSAYGVCLVAKGGYVWNSGTASEVPEDGGPWLIEADPFESEYRAYAVLRKQRLLSDFEQLAARPTEVKIVQFAREYGPLDRPRQRTITPSSGSVALAAAMFGVPASQAVRWECRGESLLTWRTELQRFLHVREIARALSELAYPSLSPQRERAARETLEDRFGWGRAWLGYWNPDQAGNPTGELPPRKRPPDPRRLTPAQAQWRHRVEAIHRRGRWEPRETYELEQVDRADLVAAGEFFVQYEINRRLEGRVHLAVTLTPSGTFKYAPDSLLGAIYLRLAREVVGADSPERHCDYCHLPFPQTRRDKRFCNQSCRDAFGYRERGGKPTRRQVATLR
jgi:hypothetical protein